MKIPVFCHVLNIYSRFSNSFIIFFAFLAFYEKIGGILHITGFYDKNYCFKTHLSYDTIITVLEYMNKYTEDEMKIPEIKAFAAKLMHTCLLLIVIYTLFTVIYIHFSSNVTKLVIGREMLESAVMAAVLSLGGTILLDFEIRLHENKNNS